MSKLIDRNKERILNNRTYTTYHFCWSNKAVPEQDREQHLDRCATIGAAQTKEVMCRVYYNMVDRCLGKNNLLRRVSYWGVGIAEEWLKDETVFVVNSLYVEDYQYGLYFYKTSDIGYMANRVNRMSRALNLSFGTIYTRMIQKGMQMELEQAAFLDPMTQISNLKGLEKWFDEYSAQADTRNNALAMAIFKLDKYKYIYENYGVREIEEVASVIARVFSKNSGRQRFSARISDDEFAIVDYTGDLNDPESAQNIISEEIKTLIDEIENNDSFS